MIYLYIGIAVLALAIAAFVFVWKNTTPHKEVFRFFEPFDDGTFPK
jgi:hypothetical protein